MSATTHTDTTVTELHRLPSSGAGNPRWSLTLADGSQVRTRPNAAVGYELSENWAGRPVTVHAYARSGAVYDVTPRA